MDRTDTVIPRMARSGAHATEQDVLSATCAKDGIACGQNSPEVLRFSFIVKRIAM